MPSNMALRWVGKAIRRVTVEPILFLFMFASSLSFSAFMAITYDKSCLLLFNSTLCDALTNNATFAKGHKHEEDEVQRESSAWIMRGNICMTLPAVFSLLLWLGDCGDRYGRRMPMALSCLAAIVYSTSNIINAVYISWSPAFMLPGEVCSGLGGSYLAILMGCYTYLTHVADTDTRMLRVGVAEAAVFLSSTVSVFVSGRLVDTLGYVSVYGIVLSCQVLALLYTLLLLPDIKPSRGDSTAEDKGNKSCCLNPIRDTRDFFAAPRATKVKVYLVLLIIVLDILQLCTTGEGDILLLYLKRAPRSWSYTTYGYFKGSENFTRGATLLALLPLLKKTSLRDTTLIMAGLVSKMAALILLGLAQSTPLIFTVVAVASLQGFPSAGLRSMMASLVSTDEQGRLFGVVGATQGVVSLISTLIFNGLYPLTLHWYDGFCFQMAAGFVLVCFLIVLYQHVDIKRGGLDAILHPHPPPSLPPQIISAGQDGTRVGSPGADQQPGMSTENQQPGMSTENQQPGMSTENQQPGMSTKNQQPGMPTENQQPGMSTENQQPGMSTKNQQPGMSTKNQQPGMSTENQHPGMSTKNQQPGMPTENQQPGMPTENKQPGMSTKNQQPGMTTENQQPGMSTENQQPGMLTENKQPGMSTENQQPGMSTENQQPGMPTKNQQRGMPTENKQPGMPTENQQPGMSIKNQQPGMSTKNKQPGMPTENKQPGMSAEAEGEGAGHEGTELEMEADGPQTWGITQPYGGQQENIQ